MASSPYKHSMENMPIPPGFTRLTSFTLKRVQRDTTVAVPGKSVDYACNSSDKLRKLLRDRPWINYSEVYTISDSEEEDLPEERTIESLPNGVIRGCPDCEDCQKVIARWRPDGSCRPVLDEAPVFYPKEEEFGDPLKYIDSIRAIAEPYGICRIVPPSSWKPPSLLQEKKLSLWESCKFSTRIQQIDKLQNCKTIKNCQPQDTPVRKKRRKTLSSQVKSSDSSETDASIQSQFDKQFGFHSGPDFTLQSFKNYADFFQKKYFWSEADRHESIPSVDDIEGEFWRIVEKPTEIIEVLYGADLNMASFGSGFPKDVTKSGNSEYVQSGWNLNNIPNLPLSVLRFESSDISGVKIPWLYVGMCLSSFCWHVEDHHLYSLNYMHMGAPKVWYGVPGKDAQKFEAVMNKHLPHLFDEQPELLHNLVTQFSPSMLKHEGVSVFRCVQNEGEFVLTFPRAYHSGFNCGFNCAEAVNIAPVDWLPRGQVAVELYRQQRHMTTISHDKLLIGAASEAVRALWNIYFRREKSITGDVEWKRFSGEDGILAKTFYVRKEAEKLQRKYLCSSQCRKMDTGLDAVVRECVFCHYDLYLSAVGCSSCPNKYACLMHAKELCLCDWSSKLFLYRYNDDELDLLHDALKAKSSSVHKWALTYLGLSVQQYRVQKEVATPVNISINTSDELRDAALTGSGKQQQHRHSSGQISGDGENRGTRKSAAVPTKNDVELRMRPSPSAMAQNLDIEVATPLNRSTNTYVETRDAMVASTRLQLQHGQSLSGQMSGCNDSSWSRGTEAAQTRNVVALQEGPSSSAMARNSNDLPEKPHNSELISQLQCASDPAGQAKGSRPQLEMEFSFINLAPDERAQLKDFLMELVVEKTNLQQHAEGVENDRDQFAEELESLRIIQQRQGDRIAHLEKALSDQEEGAQKRDEEHWQALAAASEKIAPLEAANQKLVASNRNLVALSQHLRKRIVDHLGVRSVVLGKLWSAQQGEAALRSQLAQAQEELEGERARREEAEKEKHKLDGLGTSLTLKRDQLASRDPGGEEKKEKVRAEHLSSFLGSKAFVRAAAICLGDTIRGALTEAARALQRYYPFTLEEFGFGPSDVSPLLGLNMGNFSWRREDDQLLDPEGRPVEGCLKLKDPVKAPQHPWPSEIVPWPEDVLRPSPDMDEASKQGDSEEDTSSQEDLSAKPLFFKKKM